MANSQGMARPRSSSRILAEFDSILMTQIGTVASDYHKALIEAAFQTAVDDLSGGNEPEVTLTERFVTYAGMFARELVDAIETFAEKNAPDAPRPIVTTPRYHSKCERCGARFSNPADEGIHAGRHDAHDAEVARLTGGN